MACIISDWSKRGVLLVSKRAKCAQVRGLEVVCGRCDTIRDWFRCRDCDVTGPVNDKLACCFDSLLRSDPN